MSNESNSECIYGKINGKCYDNVFIGLVTGFTVVNTICIIILLILWFRRKKSKTVYKDKRVMFMPRFRQDVEKGTPQSRYADELQSIFSKPFIPSSPSHSQNNADHKEDTEYTNDILLL